MAYSVGDIFLFYRGTFTNNPYQVPTVRHFDSDGVTLLGTYSVSTPPATGNDYVVDGVAVGPDGRLYVLWGHVPDYTKLGVFDADGNWVAELATVSAHSGGHVLFAHQNGHLSVLDADSIRIYDNAGALLNTWPVLFPGGFDGACISPFDPEVLIVARDDGVTAPAARTINIETGATTSEVTIPVNRPDETVAGIYANRTTPYLAVHNDAGDRVTYISPLSPDLTTATGAPSELATASFPGGGIFHHGLVFSPWDIAVDPDGAYAWGVPFTQDNNRSGSSADSNFRTDVRRTALPGGISGLVQGDLNGEAYCINLFHGFPETGLVPISAWILG